MNVFAYVYHTTIISAEECHFPAPVILYDAVMWLKLLHLIQI